MVECQIFWIPTKKLQVNSPKIIKKLSYHKAEVEDFKKPASSWSRNSGLKQGKGEKKSRWHFDCCLED